MCVCDYVYTHMFVSMWGGGVCVHVCVHACVCVYVCMRTYMSVVHGVWYM